MDVNGNGGSGKMRILAVDDNAINLATIEQELKEKYEVVTVNSGARAVRFLSKEKPDLILLDVQMALMDGIETLKEIRTMENGVSIPVIMLTANKDRETVIEGSKLGILDYVLKPFDGPDLVMRIDRALKKVGVLPVENKELYGRVKEVQAAMQSGNQREMLIKLDEILSFKIDEEIFGRLQSVRTKLRAGDMETADRMIGRVMKMLEQAVEDEEPDKLSINAGELNARLLYVMNDLQNFKVKDASQKLEDLMRYDIPPVVNDICAEARECLDEYDDGAAEELVQKALGELMNNLM
ncbi:MAG: response regulator [Roseburia sp.]|nr:response regulator [Roseburia sp.]MCM1097016.1 response regulator [Ruminococcus flavefaciens]